MRAPQPSEAVTSRPWRVIRQRSTATRGPQLCLPALQGAEAPTRPGGPGGDVEAPAAAQEVPQDKHMEEFFQEVTAIKVKLVACRPDIPSGCSACLCHALTPVKVSVGPAFDESCCKAAQQSHTWCGWCSTCFLGRHCCSRHMGEVIGMRAVLDRTVCCSAKL